MTAVKANNLPGAIWTREPMFIFQFEGGFNISMGAQGGGVVAGADALRRKRRPGWRRRRRRPGRRWRRGRPGRRRRRHGPHGGGVGGSWMDRDLIFMRGNEQAGTGGGTDDIWRFFLFSFVHRNLVRWETLENFGRKSGTCCGFQPSFWRLHLGFRWSGIFYTHDRFSNKTLRTYHLNIYIYIYIIFSVGVHTIKFGICSNHRSSAAVQRSRGGAVGGGEGEQDDGQCHRKEEKIE